MVFKSFKAAATRRSWGRTKKSSNNSDNINSNELSHVSPEQPIHLVEDDRPMTTMNTTTTTTLSTPATESLSSTSTISDIAIAGGGIVGLVLALALQQKEVFNANLKIVVFEQAPAFHDDVGAGMGMYPNGLRVIRDISPKLLERIQQAGCPYQYRRWMRHDGTEVAVADETVLTRPESDQKHDNNIFSLSALDEAADTSSSSESLDPDLQPIGIRRWRLQKILYEAAVEAGIDIQFGKRLDTLKELTDDTISLRFDDGTTHATRLLVAADGAKSKIRSIATKGACTLKYTGTTCLMGTSATPRADQGLSLPSSLTTKCHGAFYPTGPSEQCFQFHFPVDLEKESIPTILGGWGGMTHHMSQEECEELAKQLEQEGWDTEKFLQPLQNVEKALKIGLTTLDPPLKTFTFRRIVLIGDAAHPPVPYLGQGAQQGLEDAGTLAMLLKRFCLVPGYPNPSFSLDRVNDALELYNHLRVPRTTEMVQRGKLAGEQQQKRAENKKYNRVREEMIKREIFYNENSNHLFPGVKHDYKEAVLDLLTTYDRKVTEQEQQRLEEARTHQLVSVPEEE